MNSPAKQKPLLWDGSLYPLFFSFAFVVFFRMLFGDIWPLYWPDEALFSSPAASLAHTGRFASPVLAGLIPGMERATLWNSPLFMFLLAQVYRFTGESLFVARSLSTLLGFFCLLIFARIVRQGRQEKRILPLALLSLALDLSFLRSANAARMDMLSLFWVLLAVFFFAEEHTGFYKKNKEIYITKPGALLWQKISVRSKFRFFCAGISIALAASSHPIAILLLPLSGIYVLPRLRPFLWIFLGGLLGLLAWLVYILRYPDLFLIQFRMQLERKGDIFSLFGGDTGGAFKVFLSQYGGGKVPMLLAALWMGALGLVLCLFLWKYLSGIVEADRESSQGQKKGLARKRFFRIPATFLFSPKLWVRHSLAFFCVLAIVILSSEGWYALYVGPFFLLALSSLPVRERPQEKSPSLQKGSTNKVFCVIKGTPKNGSTRRQESSESARRAPSNMKTPPKRTIFRGALKSIFLQRPLVPYFAFVLSILLFFGLREIFVWKKAEALSVWQSNVLENTESCKRIYLRLRPDPYFLLRRQRPDLPIREFIPGKLKLPLSYQELRHSYEKIDCFLLNKEMSWEPLLQRYLREKKEGFHVVRLKQPPLEDAFLWMRAK